jgi:EF-hand domain-containing protein 1
LSLKDVRPNDFIIVFGRSFYVNGCDPFTHNYFKTALGLEFPLGDGLEKIREKHPGLIIPPYNGFGDEEDSLGNVYRLVPKPPKKDYFKWVD